MIIKFTDYNKANNLINNELQEEWKEILDELSSMPLYLKSSDQAGHVGNLIFNPVGSNEYIKNKLSKRKWSSKPLPKEYNFLGTDIDFEKNGIILEVQFSNYPFLSNNLLRSELFYRDRITFHNESVKLLIIIAKAHMFPASNSTLYYEQAIKLLGALTDHDMLKMPVRVVGLFVDKQERTPAKWIEYSANRYSRKVKKEHDIVCEVISSGREEGRLVLRKIID